MRTQDQTAARFTTTNWTLVRRAGFDRAGLEELLAAYWSPIYAYLRRSGHTPQDASDLTQSFVLGKFLERDLAAAADRDLGRFRALVITCLKRFVIDEARRSARRPGEGAKALPADTLDAIEPDTDATPEQAFDRQWAAATLHRGAELTREHYLSNGLEDHWRIFETALLRPLLEGAARPSNAELARSREGMDPGRISAIVQTVKRTFQARVTDTVASTLLDDGDAGDELALLMRSLAV
ncbi:MAG: hypothetical protein AAGH64_01465 [Planctomycetota bacterium]